MSAERYFGSNTRLRIKLQAGTANDLTNPVGLQEWSYAYDPPPLKLWRTSITRLRCFQRTTAWQVGNRTASARADAISEYAANLLNQYTGRTVPGYADIIGTANTGITVTVNSQSVTR